MKIEYSDQGAKKFTFTACHSGKVRQAVASPVVISTSPPPFQKKKQQQQQNQPTNKQIDEQDWLQSFHD